MNWNYMLENCKWEFFTNINAIINKKMRSQLLHTTRKKDVWKCTNDITILCRNHHEKQRGSDNYENRLEIIYSAF